MATIGSGVAALEVRVPSLGGSPLAFDASVPARVDARTLAVEMAEQAPLQGRLVWSGAVARLWELAPLPEQRLTGDADIDLTLGGTLAAPDVGGEASLSNGRYEHFLTETVIDGLSLQARRAGSGGIALTLRGTDGASGRVRGDGRVTLAKGMAPLVDFALSFEEATLVRRDDVTAAFSGAMTFRQDQGGASLTGEMTSERIEIRLIDRLPPSVVVLDVTEINLPPGHVVDPQRARGGNGRGRPGHRSRHRRDAAAAGVRPRPRPRVRVGRRSPGLRQQRRSAAHRRGRGALRHLRLRRQALHPGAGRDRLYRRRHRQPDPQRPGGAHHAGSHRPHPRHRHRAGPGDRARLDAGAAGKRDPVARAVREGRGQARPGGGGAARHGAGHPGQRREHVRGRA